MQISALCADELHSACELIECDCKCHRIRTRPLDPIEVCRWCHAETVQMTRRETRIRVWLAVIVTAILTTVGVLALSALIGGLKP
jgi:hypothetical protein